MAFKVWWWYYYLFRLKDEMTESSAFIDCPLPLSSFWGQSDQCYKLPPVSMDLSWWVLQTKVVIFFFLFFSPLPFLPSSSLPFPPPLSLSFSPLPVSLFLFLRFKVYTCFNMLLNSCITQFVSTLIWNHSCPTHYPHNY